MAARRYTTVHDVAALRVHPDGSRIPVDGKSTGKRKDKRTLKDRRGNWVAQDAGGSATIKRHREAANDELDDETGGEVFDLTGVEEVTQGIVDKGKRKADEQEDEAQDESNIQKSSPLGKKAKRQRFQEDLTFLSPAGSAPSLHFVDSDAPVLSKDLTSANALPNPSSDLLKNIHAMASRYYHEMGQLEDVTREIRKEKRRRRRLKLSLSNASVSGSIRGDSIDNSSEEEDGSPGDTGSLGEMEEDLDEEQSQQLESSSVDLFGEKQSTKGGGDGLSSQDSDSEDGSVDEWKENYADQDMYKIFDGSALMAIGMLLQEYVAELVNVQQTSTEETEPDRPTRIGVRGRK
ncbi:hypothetical protein EUX98_g4311 [Antrodiella citrinella]|uniref:Uncharacterized protein n=1 Tax=Antrodiella citrinella TaxID=2447956 RepID=A0A4S4MUC1_9APHY|nr:hypothetical protein EUX98_g4311 [Antrodiella citrinella]